jgi:hypothetical protein
MNRRNFLRTKAAIASIPLIGLSGCLAEAESALSGDMSADGIFESLNGAK